MANYTYKQPKSSGFSQIYRIELPIV